MKTIQVGNGSAARLHRQTFPAEVRVIGVVDPDPRARTSAAEAGLEAFPDLNAIPASVWETVELWDVCTPPDVRVEVLRTLLERGAWNIMLEKPICSASQVEDCVALLERFPQARICVNEVYRSSAVVAAVRRLAASRMRNPTITMEQSKNRKQDVVKGRYVDGDGIFGIELPHGFNAVEGTGEGRGPRRLLESSLGDMVLLGDEILPRQGKGRIVYETEGGCRVTLLTAMDGSILHPLAEIDAPREIPYGDPTRYRVIILEEGDTKIVAQFEPVPGLPRFVGRIILSHKGRQRCFMVPDKPMNRHLELAVRFFKGEGENPAPPKSALAVVRFLREATQTATIWHP